MVIAPSHLVPIACLIALGAAGPALATPDSPPPQDDAARVSTTHVKPVRQLTREPARPRAKPAAPKAREADIDTEREYWRHHGVG